MDANDFFQGGYGDEASLIELVTLVGLEGLLARCGGLDGQLDQVAIFWISIYAINNQCRVALRQKFLTWTKILIRVLKVLLSKNCFCCDLGSTRKNYVFCRELANTRPTKKLKAFLRQPEACQLLPP